MPGGSEQRDLIREFNANKAHRDADDAAGRLLFRLDGSFRTVPSLSSISSRTADFSFADPCDSLANPKVSVFRDYHRFASAPTDSIFDFDLILAASIRLSICRLCVHIGNRSAGGQMNEVTA
jgi:hypothetical protein